ncbi:alpha/beta hydrolase-fold protein [Hymenobacter metallicola]|uniref:T9SS type A sorting domain-containing protein n=1 Tax=Hymenobacter metallicola TaxID=2563114 RepID=A0A4Z0QII9_9BACT|nr:alpha/beta hydrolase-fold protein [Hymenobacter metallicola]TGE29119.1 T9SS type A sorting domain-containing protein [Hymenobacter metallicola]
MKHTLSLLLLLATLGAHAQVTLKLASVPANTPATATLYVAGSFNSWNPGSAAHALTKNADGSYQITLPHSTGTIEYKFTRGAWASVETNAANGSVPNRSYTFGAGPATVAHTVLNWEDLAGGSSCTSSALNPNVRVMATAFQIPQLGRTRRVWLYLPNDYATNTAKRYPVLYLHDGQNVFDNCTSFSGEWGVDETLSQLQQQGLDATGSIVVAVDNDGQQRLNEYSPWNNPQYGGGQGDQYVDFLVQTLKPYIDSNYRTLTGREYTGIAGSSMGGLISVYAALKYPQVYSKVGVFSPAFWFAEQPLFQYVQQHPANPATRFYFVSGTQESQTMVPLMQQMRDALQSGGVPAANLSFQARPDGQHAEWFWKREFGAAYQWLSAPATVTAASPAQTALAFSVYPVPARDAVTVQLPETVKEARLEVLDSTGRIMLKSKVRSGQAVDVRKLSKGAYFLRLTAGKQAGSQALIKE